MTRRKNEIPLQIFKLARDLNLKPGSDPVGAIVNHCERQIKNFLSDMTACGSLTEMLEWVANKVGTIFKTIHSDADMIAVQQEFLDKGEKCFANLDKELSSGVFGVTFRRQNAMAWEPAFVSVIDCRGDKAARSYFTKWHEIAHLLTLTQQLRLVFRRTHSDMGGDDPEERLMDKIAGRFGFYAPVFHKLVTDRISFFEIERLRLELCPESSSLAAFINFVKYWPTPCIFIKAEMGLNNQEKLKLGQSTFDFLEEPKEVLRAVKATANDKAKEIGFRLFDNMRVPEKSAIYGAFHNGEFPNVGVEDLSWWAGQNPRPVIVETRVTGATVEALIAPL